MYEAEYRGKEKITGKWVFGSLIVVKHYVTENALHKIVPFENDGNYPDVIPETVGKYIGIKDKNGARIYAGDIVKKETGHEVWDGIFVVIWHEIGSPSFVLRAKDGQAHSLCYDDDLFLTVIGNIHDNPGLELSNTDEYVNCPFCGNRDQEKFSLLDGNRVMCEDCHATGPYSNLKDEAIEAWNTRYEDKNSVTLDKAVTEKLLKEINSEINNSIDDPRMSGRAPKYLLELQSALQTALSTEAGV
jgi:uncharacterized phage protein (TIGR01671 family)